MKLKNVAIGCLIASSAVASSIDIEEDDIFEELVGQDSAAKSGDKSASDEPQSNTKVEHPDYTPYEGPGAKEAFFFEQFDEGAEKRWKASNAKKDDEFSFVGKWAFEEAKVLPGFKGDRGLVVKSPAAHHAMTTRFKKPFDNKDNTLVVQYEVKLQNGLECGGAYLKLLSENAALHAEEFNNETPYQIMFGPDKCGTTNKVHLIIRRKNPKSGEYEEKHLAMPAAARLNKLSNLYTLVLNPDQTFEVRINGDVVRAGNMLEDGAFRPSFNPPTEIEDENDVKPKDWIDDEYMPDPDQAEKPDDWDEEAPFQIPDPEAEKPEDWLDDEPTEIEDPEAEMPEDWDEEEDGEYVAPLVPNPVCEEVSGCGEWKAPLIKNPDFKGKWVQPKVKNPDYVGPWSPRLIPNPNYFEDETPSNLEPIGGIGFELWTMQPEILFNNIYLGHSVEQAEEIGNATFVPKIQIERKEEEALAPEPIKKGRKQYESAMAFFREDPVGYVVEVSRNFILSFAIDQKQAIIDQPLVATGFGVAFVSVFAVLAGALSVVWYMLRSLFVGKKQPAAATGKKSAGKKAEGTSEAKTSSSSSGTTSATKRRTG